MHLSLANIIHILIVAQCLFQSFFLLTHGQDKVLSNRVLAGLLLLFAAQMGVNLAEDQGWMSPVTVGLAFGYLYGPFFYFWVKTLIYKEFRFKAQHGLHLLPSLTGAALLLTGFQPQTLHATTVFFSLAAYLTASVREVRHYHQVLGATRADHKLKLGWLGQSLFYLASFFLLDVAYYFTGWEGFYVLLMLAIFLFIINIAYKGMKHPQLFSGITPEDEQLAQPRTPSRTESEKYAASTLEPDQADQYVQQLRDYMAREKPYLEPDLTLRDLARRLQIQPKHLSQVVNSGFQCNFSEFVNRFRVEEAQRFMMDGSERTVLEILHQVGFNSKSAFNAAFKKQTGMTPTQFKKRGSQQDPSQN